MTSQLDGFEKESSTFKTGLAEQVTDTSLGNQVAGGEIPVEGALSRAWRYLTQKIGTCEQRIDNEGNVNPRNYISNKVNNRKYSVLTFLPMFLYNEYKIFSNMYFLMIALCQFYEPFKIGLIVTYFFPLALVTGLSLMKEIWDEYKRKKKDDEVNAEKYTRLMPQSEDLIRSDQIRVGHVLRLEKNQRVPADMVLLHTSDASGTVFVRTDQLDGETDWKVREAVKVTQKLSRTQLFAKSWSAVVEPPSEFIYDFKGGFYSGAEFEPLRLANTVWANMKVASGDIVGVVVYTGLETRMAQNAKEAGSKNGKTDDEINFLTKVMFVLLGIITLGMYFLSRPILKSDFYVQIVRTFLLLSSIIPISLKVNVDFAKLYYSFLINNDKELDGVLARNSAIPEELGRIQYLLSDKTGTLTRNEMVFRHLRSPAGEFTEQTFDRLRKAAHKTFAPDASDSGVLKHTLLSLMLCNNVSPTSDENGRALQASSPDEVALVNFAETLGFRMEARTPDRIVLRLPDETVENWTVLENFPFTSETRRMGIVLRRENSEEAVFFLKGADSIMVEKLNAERRMYAEEEAEKLSKEGLRTLVFAYKKLNTQAYNKFRAEMNEAGKILKLRDKEERKCVERLEENMELLAVTGVEDLLQEDIKASILTLRNAGVKVWMLTGDKLETAKCIAVSTGFKSSDQKFHEVTSTRESEVTEQLHDFQIENTLLVSGASLEIIFGSKSLIELFFEKAKDSSSVVLCRCAPKQKAEVTTALRARLNKVVCAIGDGGNDVGMIQCANLGIGIEGKEGLQAALASDFSVKKFNQIVRLILWHGRLSYVRTSLLHNFVMHRGFVISVIQVMFMIMFYFVTVFIFNGYLTICYPTIFTNFPVFALILDEDVPLRQTLNYPELYQLVQEGKLLSIQEFLVWLWKSIFQGAVIIILALAFIDNTMTEFVTIMFTALIFLEYLNIYTVIRTWHRKMTYAIIISIAIYLFSLIFLKDLFYLSNITLSTAFQIFLITLAAWLPFQLYQIIQRRCFPSAIDKIINEAKAIERRMVLQKIRLSRVAN